MGRVNSKVRQLSDLTEEQKAGAKAWLDENYPYVIACATNVLSKSHYIQYKKPYKSEAVSEAVEVVYLYHHRYIKGDRSLNSWLYRMMSFHIRNYMNRKVIPYEQSKVSNNEEFPILDRVAVTDDFSPAFEDKEYRLGKSIWDHKIIDEAATVGEILI